MLRSKLREIRNRGEAVQRQAEHDQQNDRDQEDDLLLIGSRGADAKAGEMRFGGWPACVLNAR
jgi:hypothetical protein